MKKIFGTLILLSLFVTVNGQIKRKAVLLGGQVSFDQVRSDYSPDNTPAEYTQRVATYGLSIGMAVKRNTVVGLTGSISPRKISQTVNGIQSVTETDTYEAGLFFRKYKLLLRKFYFFNEIDGVARFSKTEMSAPNTVQSKEKGGHLGLTPGLSYQVLKNLYMEIAISDIIGVSYTKITNDWPDPVRNSYVEDISIFSSLNNDNQTIGGVGIGFRLIF